MMTVFLLDRSGKRIHHGDTEGTELHGEKEFHAKAQKRRAKGVKKKEYCA
jgi:hypothetical protein